MARIFPTLVHGTGRALATMLALLCWLGAANPAAAQDIDPRAVQRWQSGWRHPQAGWTVVHIEGEPYERGLQHGHLLAHEIASYIDALSRYWGPEAPRQAWEQNRRLANALFLRSFTKEQLQEMKGIADGAAAEGASVNGRPVELADIVTINSSNEIDTLDDALAATPTGLEGLRKPPAGEHRSGSAAQPRRKKPLRCNAFAAIGPATRDGKLVFGHITMYDLYPANYYNVWMEVRPSQGLRFVMQTTPGGMHSGMDYSINEAGLLLSETTLDQGPLAASGVSLASRIRQAQQYAGDIDSAVEILERNGNGLVSTEWILADIRRNEIALLTLGTHERVLRRSSRNEWLAGAEGFYWSDNNIKDRSVRLETAGALDGRPSTAAVYEPSKRDAVWLRMYEQSKGAIDLEFARRMLSTPEIVSAYAVDAKYTDATLAANFQTWASFGPPVGAIWQPGLKEQMQFPGIKPLIHNPWTLLGTRAPPAPRPDEDAAIDLQPPQRQPARKADDKPNDPPAWHGTLLPASDADIWLATAFANYERIVALEHRLRRDATDEEAPEEALDAVAVEIAYYRSLYELGVRAGRDVALAQTKSSMRDQQWHRVAAGKGVLLLHSLRGIIGAETFDRAMDEFGRSHAGEPVSSRDFERFLQARTGQALGPLFDWWLNRTGLPRLGLLAAKAGRSGRGWQTQVELDGSRLGPLLSVPVTVETEDGELTREFLVSGARRTVTLNTAQRPSRVTVDKYGTTARGNGSPFTILTLDDELEQVLIVAGTQDEAAGNLEAARLLQHSLRRREHNVLPRLTTDRELTDEDLRRHHLLLVGRPATNLLTARLATRLPVAFGPQSFEVRDELYAHPESAVIAAGENPFNPRYSVVMVAGLSSLGTWQVMSRFMDEQLTYAPVVVLPHGREDDSLVPPLAELTRELD